jgi:hypothetical protein
MKNEDWDAAGMGASMIVLWCAIALVLCIAWGVVDVVYSGAFIPQPGSRS